MTKKANRTGIPGNKEIVDEAFAYVSKNKSQKLKPSYIEKNFSEVTEMLFEQAYKVYLKYENVAKEDLRKSIASKLTKNSYSKSEVVKLIESSSSSGASFEKSLSQSRASRAGKAFELIVMKMFDIMEIPHEHITKEDEKSGLRPIDIVVPDRATAIKDPFNAHFLSLKTSLKDRWKLVSPDQKQGQRTHLITLLQRENLSEPVAKKIAQEGIILYIPDEIKRKNFANNKSIRKLSDLPAALK